MLGTINLEVYFEKIQSIGWAVLPLDHRLCDGLRLELLNVEARNLLQQSSLANAVSDSTIRNDFTSWINLDSEHNFEKKLIHMLSDLQKKLKNYFRISLNHFELHYAKYPVGHFYKKHSDQKTVDNKRFFSFIIYLNSDWKTHDGGELCGYNLNSNEEIFRIPPNTGTMIIFKSDIVHEVLTTQRDRYSIAGWMRTI